MSIISGKNIRLEKLSSNHIEGAMERLGFHLEGRFRNEWILPDGRVRSCFVYSVIDSEWPKFKTKLSMMAHQQPFNIQESHTP